MKWHVRDQPRSKCNKCGEIILWMSSIAYNPFNDSQAPVKWIAVNFNWDHERDRVIKPEHVRHTTTCKIKQIKKGAS